MDTWNEVLKVSSKPCLQEQNCFLLIKVIVATLNAFYYLCCTLKCYQSHVHMFKNNNSYTKLLVDCSNNLHLTI